MPYPMQRILIPFLFIFISFHVAGQFNPELSRVFGGNSLDHAVDIAVNIDSALFLGARTFSSDGDVPSNNGGSDFWIMKTDLDGNPIWKMTYGGFNNDDLSNVMPNLNGGLVAFGTTRNEHGEYGDLTGLAGAWLIQVDGAGNLLKGKVFGGDISDNGIDAVRHFNGTVTMAIEASSPELDHQDNHGVLDVWIVQVDINFNLRWSKLLGGSLQDSPAAIATDLNGSIYVAASSKSNLPGLDENNGEEDVWIFKLSPTGDLLWQRSFGGSAEDIATDILLDPSGKVYVLAQSNSSDGDFDANYGFSDLWLIELDADNGDTGFLQQYGGKGIDVNGRIDRFGDDHFLLTATSNSDSIDLTSNKGFNDVWVFVVDTLGAIQQQMNYGGSLNDVTGGAIVFDSSFYLLNSTFSEDGNVPQNIISQQDLWLFRLNTDPDPCSNQFLCQQDSTLSNELFPPSTEVLVCVSGCTAGLERGPDFIPGGCDDFIYPTAYYKLSTDVNADLLTLSVSSSDFNEPRLALLRTNNCNSFTQVACGTGENGSLLMNYIDVEPQTTYIIAVSDAVGNLGSFELCATVVDVEFCNQKDTLYVNAASMGSPLSGPFLPGEEVQICYELLDWNKIDCNGFQGLIPKFGPGWDSLGFDFFGMPLQVDSMLVPVTPNGFWDWHMVGDVHYNIANPIAGYGGGQGMAPGWYFTNQNVPPPNDHPDLTTGDIYTCLPSPDKWKVCFTLPVKEECVSDMDLSISMRSFSDGELGLNPSLACAYDQPENLIIGMVCCINPTVQNIPDRSVCSGDTVILVPQTNILPPVSYSWTFVADPGVEGATTENNLGYFYQTLTNETTEVLDVHYTLWAEGLNCTADPVVFTVHVYPKPTTRITITGPSIVCSGATVQFNLESTGTPPFAIEITRDNLFFANVLSESTLFTLEVDPVLSGRFRVGNVRDAFCDGEGLGFVNVTVKPVGTAIIDTAICEGSSIVVGNEIFDEAGNYILTLEEAAANNCDSIISLSLSVIPSITQDVTEVICRGDTLAILDSAYTETTQILIEYIGSQGCPDYINLDLTVIDTFVEEVDQTICYGDTVTFEGIAVFQSGTYSHVEETMPGCFLQKVLNLNVLPAITIHDLSIMGDHGNNDGAILVEITGGSPPFSFLWSSGQTSESLFNVMHGSYQLTVTDRLGCMQIFEFEVPMVTGIDEDITGALKVWPTLLSSSEQITIYQHGGSVRDIRQITCIDMNGRLIQVPFKQVSASQLLTVPLPDGLNAGMYVLSIEFANGIFSRHKLIVE